MGAGQGDAAGVLGLAEVTGAVGSASAWDVFATDGQLSLPVGDAVTVGVDDGRRGGVTISAVLRWCPALVAAGHERGAVRQGGDAWGRPRTVGRAPAERQVFEAGL